MIFGNDILQWIADRIIEAFTGFTGPTTPLFSMVSNTSFTFTIQNPIVIAGWQTMTVVADLFLGLFIVIGAIQLIYGDTTGSLRMPIGQFVGKILVTALLIHLSAFIGEQLLTLNNLLCNLVAVDIGNFIRGINQGQLFGNRQVLLLGIGLTVVFGIGIFRVIFQAVNRIIRFNLLFVLSGPAYLMSFHPATAPVFSFWIRLYVVTIFEQFIQFLAFGLGVQFLIATKQTGITGFILAAAMVNMTAGIPKILERFGVAGSQGTGFSSLASTVVKVAAMFA